MDLSPHILKNFEFEKILDRLASACLSAMARDRALSLRPLSQEEATRALQETEQYSEMTRFDGSPGLEAIPDLSTVFSKTSVQGSSLLVSELLSVQHCILISHRVKSFFQQEYIVEKYSLLSEYSFRLHHFSVLRRSMEKVFSPAGEVLDNASGQLSQIRRRIRRLEEDITSTIGDFLSRSEHSRFLQESHYTIRRGRYVVPVKNQYRNQVEGLIIDSSSSGSTVFVEPRPLLFLNNELEVTLFREREEIERIMRTLTDEVRKDLVSLEESYRVLVDLDFLQAKSQVARQWNAHPCHLGTLELALRQARHPFLGERAVPFDLVFTPDNRVMVVSGPNAGGKTVLLKSVALLVTLAWCGVPIPASPDSEIPFFENMFVDIGDHQDIEKDLSTFTSRLIHLKEIIQKASPRSLVLLDEIGAGTDPEEGAALAVAVLDRLKERGATSLVSTHYQAVKHYAYKQQGMLTASMELDPHKMLPTYHLLVGEIGASYGLLIARRIGLPAHILEAARSFLKKEWLNLNELVLEERKRVRKAEQLQQEWNERNSMLAEKEKILDARIHELDSRRREITELFQKELKSYLKETKDHIARLVGDLRQEKTLDEEVYSTLKGVLNQGKRKIDSLSGEREKEDIPVFSPGEEVVILPLGAKGIFLSLDPNKQEAVVEVSGRKVRTPVKELCRGSGKTKTGKRGPVPRKKDSPLHEVSGRGVTDHIEIRRMRMEEARDALEKYLDRAIVSGHTTVFIVHGKGEGILKRMTEEVLQEHPCVASFRPGESGEGGEGVTVAKLQ